MSNLGERLKLLREENGYTQEELSKKLKITRQSISNYEKNKRNPDYETVELIADFFNVDLDYLYGRTDTPHKEFNIEIGARIREARKKSGLSLKEVGDLIGLSEGNIQRYEAGKIKGVDVNIIKKLAKILKCSEQYLMGWEEHNEEVSLVAAHATADLSDEEIEEVLDFVKYIKSKRKN